MVVAPVVVFENINKYVQVIIVKEVKRVARIGNGIRVNNDALILYGGDHCTVDNPITTVGGKDTAIRFFGC